MTKNNLIFSPEKYEELRIESGLKKKEVAEKAGFKACELSRYLTGKTEPMGPRLVKLAKAINAKVEQIVMDASEKKFDIYTSTIELYFGDSGIKSILRDGVVFWETKNQFILSKDDWKVYTFELPDIFAPTFLQYIAEGLDRDHPQREQSRQAAAEVVKKAIRVAGKSRPVSL